MTSSAEDAYMRRLSGILLEAGYGALKNKIGIANLAQMKPQEAEAATCLPASKWADWFCRAQDAWKSELEAKTRGLS